MAEISLNEKLKQIEVLNTDIGDFTYVNSLGEGGNSFVFQFTKGNKNFAVKFLKPADDRKLKRFKDEYFCAMQIATHKHLVQAYHFDSVLVQGENHFIIIMKCYDNALSALGNIASKTEEQKSESGWKLFKELIQALHHLHANSIIHRDLKPQNIFFDSEIDSYVLGDLGIAHFSKNKFAKESKTKPSEKLANYSYSAPEQINSKKPPHQTSDIYSLGQVLQWYLTGTTIRGLGRTRISNSKSPQKLQWLDSIIEKSIRNDPKDRFQSIDEIVTYVKKLKNPPRNYWKALHAFDDVIRRSFPKIKKLITTSETFYIERFLSNFNSLCNPDDFWYMNIKGGDNTYQPIMPIDGNKWLFCDEEELEITKLFVYRDYGYPYKNFFVLLISPSEPFDIVDSAGGKILRDISIESEMDFAVFWNGKYIDANETQNGYFEFEGKVISVDRDAFRDRMRHLKKYAYIVVPQGTATAIMVDRRPTEEFLTSIVEKSEISDLALKTYLDATRQHHSREITQYN